MDLKPDLARPFARLLGDVFGAPGDILEHVAMRGLEPEQIIAAVARRTEHGAVARPRQRCGGLDQERRRQSRTVGIEHDGGRMSAGEDLLDRVQQAIAEIRQPGVDQADRARQGAAEEVLGAGRTVGRVAGDAAWRSACRSQQHIVGDVLQETRC